MGRKTSASADAVSCSKLKKQLNLLTRQVYSFLAQLDVEMSGPPTHDRGIRIAILSNALDIANDSAMHYGLDLSFEQIRLRKNAKSRMVAQ
jgi:hypothetical protein